LGADFKEFKGDKIMKSYEFILLPDPGATVYAKIRIKETRWFRKPLTKELVVFKPCYGPESWRRLDGGWVDPIFVQTLQDTSLARKAFATLQNNLKEDAK
jgi:hypothetical protein